RVRSVAGAMNSFAPRRRASHRPNPGGRAGGSRFARAQQLNRPAVAVQRADIDIRLAGADAVSLSATSDICIEQRAEILVLLIPLAPQPIQIVEDPARQLEGAPDPERTWVRLFDLNIEDPTVGGGDHR